MNYDTFSLPEMTDEIVNNKVISTNNSEKTSPLNENVNTLLKVGSSSSVNTDMQPLNENVLSVDMNKNDYKTEVLNSMVDSSPSYEKDYSPERDLEDLLSIVEPCQDVSKASSDVDSGAASDSADTSCAQHNLLSLTESELTSNEDMASRVSYICLN